MGFRDPWKYRGHARGAAVVSTWDPKQAEALGGSELTPWNASSCSFSEGTVGPAPPAIHSDHLMLVVCHPVVVPMQPPWQTRSTSTRQAQVQTLVVCAPRVFLKPQDKHKKKHCNYSKAVVSPPSTTKPTSAKTAPHQTPQRHSKQQMQIQSDSAEGAGHSSWLLGRALAPLASDSSGAASAVRGEVFVEAALAAGRLRGLRGELPPKAAGGAGGAVGMCQGRSDELATVTSTCWA